MIWYVFKLSFFFFFFFPFEFVNLFNFESEKVEKLKCKQKFTELMELYAENTIPNIFSIDFLKQLDNFDI